MGTCLHWDQQRVTTVMEVRRAQGFPDDEVLVGTPADKWKVIGNSVARTVALALGLSLRDAWLKNSPDKHAEAVETAAKAMLPATQSNGRTHRVSHGKIRQSIAIASDKSANPEVSPVLNTGRPLGPPQRLHGAPKETRIMPVQKPLKRRHSTLQETRILPPEKSYKILRLEATTSDLTRPITSMNEPRGPTAQPVKAPGPRIQLNPVQATEEDHLAISLLDVQHGRSTAGGDEREEKDFSVLNSVVSKLQSKFQTGMARAQGTGRSRAPSNGKPKTQPFIDLVSTDEDEISVVGKGLSQRRILPPPKSVANGKLNAYSQTKQALNRGGSKKLRVAG